MLISTLKFNYKTTYRYSTYFNKNENIPNFKLTSHQYLTQKNIACVTSLLHPEWYS